MPVCVRAALSSNPAAHPSLVPRMMSQAANKESEVDVLIIGAGPAGVMCANALAMAGVNVRIIDQRFVERLERQSYKTDATQTG